MTTVVVPIKMTVSQLDGMRALITRERARIQAAWDTTDPKIKLELQRIAFNLDMLERCFS